MFQKNIINILELKYITYNLYILYQIQKDRLKTSFLL